MHMKPGSQRRHPVLPGGAQLPAGQISGTAESENKTVNNSNTVACNTSGTVHRGVGGGGWGVGIDTCTCRCGVKEIILYTTLFFTVLYVYNTYTFVLSVTDQLDQDIDGQHHKQCS